MVNCPICNQPLPSLLRKPVSFKQAMYGGWTCPKCKSELDRNANVIKRNEDGIKKYEDSLYKEEYIREKARLQAQKEHKNGS